MSKQTTARRSRVAYAVAVAALIVGATAFVGLRDAETNTASAAAATFTEEFNGPAGSGVDGSRWKHEIGNGTNGWGNHERQYYTDGTKNAALDGQGNLVITAKRENPAGYDCWFGKCEYTSAKFSTAQTFTQTYGRFETRMKLPRGQGIWPAFWMLGTDIGSVGWPNSGEIDIMENVGKEPGTVHGTLHGPGYSGAEGVGAGYTLPNGQAFADAFHTFAVDWSPNRISWSVDGNVYQTRTPADLGGDRWVFDKPFYMILNLAVGGDWPGSPDGSTRFPQQLVVDYIRVTDTSGGGGVTGPTGQITGIGGKCVDVNAASTANGTAVQLYSCNGSGAQKWTWATDGSLRALGKCLDVPGGSTADGAKLQLWDCNGSAAQKWVYSGANDIVNPQANKCVDATEQSSANLTRLQLWTCSGNANQKWTAPRA